MLFSTAVASERAGALRKKERTRSGKRGHHQQPDRHCRPTHMGAMSLNRLQLARQLRIADFIGVKVSKADAHAVLHFALPRSCRSGATARIVPDLPPHVGEKNVAGIATIHHPLRDVDARAGNVGLLVQVR